MENNFFEYTYSAQRQKEVEEIRKAYLPKEEDKMAELRRLHAIPTKKAQAASLAAGVMGALILGTGMSLILTELGMVLGDYAMILGIVVGLAGMILMVLAYPVYSKTLQKERKKIAPEILQLTETLL
ncbi:MAG: hypothetical protein J6V25_09835 [Oscillospiraceae bacterium]|nr:hypothetical protein [Oscillospiraceae bacterium]